MVVLLNRAQGAANAIMRLVTAKMCLLAETADKHLEMRISTILCDVGWCDNTPTRLAVGIKDLHHSHPLIRSPSHYPQTDWAVWGLRQRG